MVRASLHKLVQSVALWVASESLHITGLESSPLDIGLPTQIPDDLSELRAMAFSIWQLKIIRDGLWRFDFSWGSVAWASITGVAITGAQTTECSQAHLIKYVPGLMTTHGDGACIGSVPKNDINTIMERE